MQDNEPRKILADGTEVPASDPRTDHVAVMFPETGWMIAVAPLAKNGRAFSTQQDVEQAAKDLRLLGFGDWMLAPDTVYDRHVIDRRFHKPAANASWYPGLILDDWYWTSTTTPWFAAGAFGVDLNHGDVNSNHGYSGFGLACRRASLPATTERMLEKALHAPALINDAPHVTAEELCAIANDALVRLGQNPSR